MPRTAISRKCFSDDRPYSDAEAEFFKAVQDYQKRTGRKFLEDVELLRIAVGIGYAKAKAEDEPC